METKKQPNPGIGIAFGSGIGLALSLAIGVNTDNPFQYMAHGLAFDAAVGVCLI